MPENMDKWASGNRKIPKSGHRVAAEMIPFPRRWHGSVISANLEAIWGMSLYKWLNSCFRALCLGMRLPRGATRAPHHFIPKELFEPRGILCDH